MLEPMFKVGDRVRKQGGDYGGPGDVIGVVFIPKGDGLQHTRYVVAHKIEGGFGYFINVYSPGQIFKDMGEPVPLDIQADIARQEKALDIALDGKNEVIDKQRQRINDLEDQILKLKGELARQTENTRIYKDTAESALSNAKHLAEKNIRLDNESGKLRDEIQILQQGIIAREDTIRTLIERIDKIREVTNDA